jgi:hypothetical protein
MKSRRAQASHRIKGRFGRIAAREDASDGAD